MAHVKNLVISKESKYKANDICSFTDSKGILRRVRVLPINKCCMGIRRKRKNPFKASDHPWITGHATSDRWDNPLPATAESNEWWYEVLVEKSAGVNYRWFLHLPESSLKD